MKAAVYRGHSKDPRQVVKILNVLEYYQFAMYKPKILVLGLAIAISIFSLAYINLAIAQTEQTEGFTAALSGGEEVPPVDTTATGVASFTVMGEESVKYDVNVTGMDKATAAHIHSAPKGENGEV
ncbi:MAG: CHRD domain-containing protein, partial [Nitrososphaeraceae archaeon]|nr:CHRD domain-containing protein [Nitrososphaeraceae archaeon]